MRSRVGRHLFSSGSRSRQMTSETDNLRTISTDTYRVVISRIRDAESILIYGPVKVNDEFEKRLAKKVLGRRIVGIEQLAR